MDFDSEGAEVVTKSINESGGAAHCAVVDLTDWEATETAVKEAHRRAGSIDVLVHSAGGFPKYVSLLDCPVDTWDGIVDSNLKSMFYLLKATAPLMVEAKYGRFVTLSSMAARSGVNPNPPHYTAAKGGVLALTRQAALELGPHGVTVNAVAPANVNSPRGLANRDAKNASPIFRKPPPYAGSRNPTRLPRPSSFLCSREAGYITGVTLDVNGGATMV